MYLITIYKPDNGHCIADKKSSSLLLLHCTQQVIEKERGRGYRLIAMAGDGEEMRNKQVLAGDYVDGNPKETDTCMLKHKYHKLEGARGLK